MPGKSTILYTTNISKNYSNKVNCKYGGTYTVKSKTVTSKLSYRDYVNKIVYYTPSQLKKEFKSKCNEYLEMINILDINHISNKLKDKLFDYIKDHSYEAVKKYIQKNFSKKVGAKLIPIID